MSSDLLEVRMTLSCTPNEENRQQHLQSRAQEQSIEEVLSYNKSALIDQQKKELNDGDLSQRLVIPSALLEFVQRDLIAYLVQSSKVVLGEPFVS